MISIQPVILSGGSGTRLWPLSRLTRPKQFLAVTGEESLLVQTARRFAEADDFRPPLFVCNGEHRFLVAEAMREASLKPGSIILEPCPRNTAAAAIAAAVAALAQDSDALLLYLPSDHLIGDDAVFRRAVRDAAPAALAGHFVCFGVRPLRPETGFGYIAAGASLAVAPGARKVERFIEKPSAERAEKFLAEGNYLWNAGVFLFHGPALMAQMETLEPDLVAACRAAVDGAVRDLDFLRLDETAFAAAKNISIDHALMEKTSRAAVADVAFDWSDLGSFSALWEVGPKDEAGNSLVGDVVVKNTQRSYLYSESQLLTTIDVADLAVVATSDAVLVAPLEKSAELKALVAELRQAGRSEIDSHVTVHRPWGSYQTIIEGPRYKVKEIIVHPGRRLSGQYHNHRAEHWVVVEGEAEIQHGDVTCTLTEDQSLYIPLGTVHRLKNPGKGPLRLIEVQTGSYLEEDDIVRLDDDYGRLAENNEDA